MKKNEIKESGMVRHNPDVVTKVRVEVATMPGVSIGNYFDEAVIEKLNKKPKNKKP